MYQPFHPQQDIRSEFEHNKQGGKTFHHIRTYSGRITSFSDRNTQFGGTLRLRKKSQSFNAGVDSIEQIAVDDCYFDTILVRGNSDSSKTDKKIGLLLQKRDKELEMTNWTEKHSTPQKFHSTQRKGKKFMRKQTFENSDKKSKNFLKSSFDLKTFSYEKPGSSRRERKNSTRISYEQNGCLQFKTSKEVVSHYMTLVNSLEKNREQSLRKMLKRRDISKQVFQYVGQKLLEKQKLRKTTELTERRNQK